MEGVLSEGVLSEGVLSKGVLSGGGFVRAPVSPAYIDAFMLGVYCLNRKAVFIMIDQGNDVGYLDLFTYVHCTIFFYLHV